jgi:tetratricopeptide (TPR) repeat protein/predicted Ser/Thr protein kinase
VPSDPESDSAPTVRGPTIVGRYEIVQAIGHGGMGNLYLARDPRIGNRRVVIKLLREAADSPEVRERFAREAEAAGGLHHANIVTIFDVGEFHTEPFIAMEYIEGETLTEIIRRRAKLSVTRKIQLMEELCAGLHFAHRAGVVHRDIKPANVMVDQEGVLKILDFGIARLGGSQMTRTGIVIGTLNYMAPEQMSGQHADARADMFSAGAVFYELLTYRQAFPGQPPAIFHTIMTATHEPIGAVAPDIDPAVAAVVERCLACERNDRYPDMAAVRRELSVIRQRIAADEQAQLQRRVDEARAAMGAGDFETALNAAEEALALDSDCAPAQEVHLQAQALFKRRKVERHLTDARAALREGALTRASLFLDEALDVDPDSADAKAAREDIDAARRRAAAIRERDMRVAALLQQARTELETDAERALQTADEAVRVDPQNDDARALHARITAVVAAERKAAQEARERAERQRAAAAIETARRDFADGRYAEAIAALEAFAPREPVERVLNELRAERADIERRAADAERERAAAERGRREPDTMQRAETIVNARTPLPPIDEATVSMDRTVHVDAAVAQASAARALEREAPPPKPVRVEPPRAVETAAAVTQVRAPEAVAPPAPRRLAPILAAAAAIVLIFAAVIAWRVLSQRPTPGPGEATSVVLDVAPWATIDAITRQSDGQTVVGSPLVTPCVVQLPPGAYHLRASNPNFVTAEFDFTVASGGTQELRFEMPGFDVEAEAASILRQ